MKKFFERLTEPETFIEYVISTVALLFWWGWAQTLNHFTTPYERAAARAMWDETGAGNGY